MESINPFTLETLNTYPEHNQGKVQEILDASNRAYNIWKKIDIEKRRRLNQALAENLKLNKTSFALLITNEMGKPIRESIAEIEKCIWLCEHYAQETTLDFSSKKIHTEAKSVFVSYEPLGVLFAIMPWNFPFWQVLRFAIPALTAGNTVILKHAPNVTGCALAIEKLFLSSGFTKDAFSVIIIPAERSVEIISSPTLKGVTLTGSEKAGKAVASLCGMYLKKCVLELGGSDAFIVFNDAELNNCCKAGLKSRMLNSGQVCIAAKRFIVHNSIYQDFILFQKTAIEKLVLGNPLEENTDIGPMARPDLLNQIEKQVLDSKKMGAQIICGGERSKIYPNVFNPTLLCNITPDMPVFLEETFGPVMAVITFDSEEEAIEIANNTRFGLGASIWTKDNSLVERILPRIEAGSVFVNSMVKSDPRTPFGGIKNSGFGRELTFDGVKEFMNLKTNWIE
ncbi:MAG: succinate-semialdehyde dehydrogenase [Bacteroidetes bacterium HGW-Bacteroidetes-1]|jgi:succinate-semialdehyde dehydrogenase/glutarate-semialdehyde dehydrogenase|nr:MAG: succinate-semialdehyde dehydrogenase [Bacteroidetes bacterium HGW-Bacteroidetes-1]